jgi:hypothetical protein
MEGLLMATIRETWEQDPEFAALPEATKSQKLLNYFEQEMVDEEFKSLPQEEQDSYRQRFKQAEGVIDEPTAPDLSGVNTIKGHTQYDLKTKKPILPGSETPGADLGNQLQERASKTYQYMKDKFSNANEDMSIFDPVTGQYKPTSTGSLWDYAGETPEDTALSLGVGLGQIAGGLGDIAGTAIGQTYKRVVPEEAQAYILDRLLDFSTTKTGKAGLAALGKGMETWDAWAKENPDMAMEIGSMLNLVGASWGGQLIKNIGQRPVKEILNAGSSIVHDLSKIGTKQARQLTQDAVNKYFLKAIKPPKSIGSSDIAIKQFKESAGNAVYDIVADKDSLKLTDEMDRLVDYRLPRTVKQFNEAIGQRKHKLFQQYDEIAKVAGDKGLTVDISDLFLDKTDDLGNTITSPLTDIANSVGLAAMDKDTVDRAMELIDIFTNRLKDGQLPVGEAQKLITAANNLKGKSPGIDSLVADFIREKMNKTMDGLVDSRYSNLKKEYGNLKAIEESVSKAAFAEMKKGVGFWDEGTTIFSLGELAKGAANLASGGKANIAKAIAAKAAQKTIQAINRPDARIRKMFEKADKAYNRIEPVKLGEADRIYADAVNSNIDNSIKQLELQKKQLGTGQAQLPPPKMPALEEGAIRMPNTASGPTINAPNTFSGPTMPLPAKLSEFKNLTSQGKVNGMYQWRDDKYGGNFTTMTDDPSEVRKALKEVRYNFKQAGDKPIKPKAEQKPFNQEEWAKELQREAEALKAKKASETMPKEKEILKKAKVSESEIGIYDYTDTSRDFMKNVVKEMGLDPAEEFKILNDIEFDDPEGINWFMENAWPNKQKLNKVADEMGIENINTGTESFKAKIDKTKIPKRHTDDILYHNTFKEEYIEDGKPIRDSYFANSRFFDEHDEFQYGPIKTAMKLPENAKVLDLRARTKESREFLKKAVMLNKDLEIDDKLEFIADLMKDDPNALYRFFAEDWYGGENLTKVMDKMGIDAVKMESEFFIPKKTISKSIGLNPKTNKPIHKQKTSEAIPIRDFGMPEMPQIGLYDGENLSGSLTKNDKMAKLKESSERVKAKTTSAFDKMAEESSEELDEVLDIWEGNADDKAGFIKWIKSDAPYDKKKYKVTASWRETITKLRKHIKD